MHGKRIHNIGGDVKMFRGGIAVLAILIGSATGAMAQAQPKPLPNPFDALFQGTPEEQAACAPDSTRFCKALEPNQLAVLGCLQQNRAKLSAACRRVLQSHGQ
jgi:hypothetical protein